MIINKLILIAVISISFLHSNVLSLKVKVNASHKDKDKDRIRISGNFSWICLGEFPQLFPDFWLAAQDHWFSDDCATCNPCDWEQEQEICKAGYDRGLLLLFIHDMQDLLRDAADLVRDYFDIPLETLRFVYCLFLSFTFQDITSLERPNDNKIVRFAPRFKREHAVNRFFDSTYEEFKVVRCFKRWFPNIIRIASSFVKYFFYFLPIWDKFTVRLGLMVGKMAITIVHRFWPSFMLTDTQAFHSYYGDWIGYFWYSFWKSVTEFWFDVMASYNEEMFVEATQWTRTFADWDNRISTLDLLLYSNSTYSGAASIHDDYKFDYHSRVDTYYCDFLAMIQSNELFEVHNTTRDKEILYQAKEEFCKAIWLPVGNPFVRTEFKVGYTKRMVKTDQKLDLSEFRCICIYVAMNIAHNSNPLAFTVEERLRMIHRYDDIVRTVDLLPTNEIDEEARQDKFLEGIIECARTGETIAENVPEFKSKILQAAETLKARYKKAISAFKSFGTHKLKARADNEIDILFEVLKSNMDAEVSAEVGRSVDDLLKSNQENVQNQSEQNVPSEIETKLILGEQIGPKYGDVDDSESVKKEAKSDKMSSSDDRDDDFGNVFHDNK